MLTHGNSKQRGIIEKVIQLFYLSGMSIYILFFNINDILMPNGLKSEVGFEFCHQLLLKESKDK